MIFGVDFSSGRPTSAALKAAGVKFVCRYLSTPGNPKNLTKAEVLGYHASGIDIVTVFETTANRALGGRSAGIADARAAQAQLTALGAPADAPVYFAVDFDATPTQQSAINGYMMGAASILGPSRVGIYGGYYPVKRALDANVCHLAWQTSAWSGGQWDPRAQLRQRGGQNIGGVSCDVNWATVADFGQWSAPTPRPPTPAPIVFPKDDTFWTWLRWRLGLGEFAVYGKMNPHVRPNVPQRIPAAWWRALKLYLKDQPST